MLFIAAIPFSLYAAEIKQFLKIPPQRLNVWILKARLSSAENRLREFEKLRSEVRYFIFIAVRALSFDLTWLFCATLVVVLPIADTVLKQQSPVWLTRIAMDVAITTGVLYFLQSVRCFCAMAAASSDHAEQKLNALRNKIERLRGRLEEKRELAIT